MRHPRPRLACHRHRSPGAPWRGLIALSRSRAPTSTPGADTQERRDTGTGTQPPRTAKGHGASATHVGHPSQFHPIQVCIGSSRSDEVGYADLSSTAKTALCCRVPAVNSVGKNLERLRVGRGWSQNELARRTPGVTQADVSRIESEETKDPGASKLRALADTLGVPLDALWGGREAMRGDDPRAGLDRFLESGLARCSEDEIAELKRVWWPWGPPTLAHWLDMLRIMRETKPREG